MTPLESYIKEVRERLDFKDPEKCPNPDCHEGTCPDEDYDGDFSATKCEFCFKNEHSIFNFKKEFLKLIRIVEELQRLLNNRRLCALIENCKCCERAEYEITRSFKTCDGIAEEK